MFRYFLYVSEAMPHCDATKVASTFARARIHNCDNAVSGLLLYDGRAFLQYLEGEPATIAALYASIARNPLHTRVKLLEEGDRPDRCVADFRAGFCEVDAMDALLALAHGHSAANESMIPHVVGQMSRYDLQ